MTCEKNAPLMEAIHKMMIDVQNTSVSTLPGATFSEIKCFFM